MGKKKQYIMDAEKEIFLYGNAKSKKPDEALVPGCIANGISEKAALTIWNKMVEFAKYAFNKSHAACYAVVAFQTAYLKKYYPEEFMAALLTSVIGQNDNLSKYCNAIQKTIGIPIISPDINESDAGFVTVNKKIRFGLESVKSVGNSITTEICAERDKNGPFTSLFDFATRLSNKGISKAVVEALIKSGAFDFTGYNRAELLKGYPAIMDAAKKEATDKASGQISLFDYMEGTAEEYRCPEIERMQDLPEEIRLKYEREVTSLYITGHPLSKYSKAMNIGNCATIREIKEDIENNGEKYRARQTVNIAVILFDVKKKLTKNGTQMVTCSIQDIDAEAQMIAFSKTLEAYDLLFKDEEVVLVKASIDIKDDGSVTFIANNLYQMPKNTDSEEAFKAFEKEVVPRQSSKKTQYQQSTVVKDKTASRYKPGLYLKMQHMSDLDSVVNSLKGAKGTTMVYIYCVETNKLLSNPSLKVNVHDKNLIQSILTIVGGRENVKLY